MRKRLGNIAIQVSLSTHGGGELQNRVSSRGPYVYVWQQLTIDVRVNEKSCCRAVQDSVTHLCCLFRKWDFFTPKSESCSSDTDSSAPRYLRRTATGCLPSGLRCSESLSDLESPVFRRSGYSPVSEATEPKKCYI